MMEQHDATPAHSPLLQGGAVQIHNQVSAESHQIENYDEKDQTQSQLDENLTEIQSARNPDERYLTLSESADIEQPADELTAKLTEQPTDELTEQLTDEPTKEPAAAEEPASEQQQEPESQPEAAQASVAPAPAGKAQAGNVRGTSHDGQPSVPAPVPSSESFTAYTSAFRSLVGAPFSALAERWQPARTAVVQSHREIMQPRAADGIPPAHPDTAGDPASAPVPAQPEPAPAPEARPKGEIRHAEPAGPERGRDRDKPSAGERPAVPLTAKANPVQLDAGQGAMQSRADALRSQSNIMAESNSPAPVTPIAPPEPLALPLEPVPAPATLLAPSRPLALPDEVRAEVDEAMAPALDQTLSSLDNQATTISADMTAQSAQVQRDMQAQHQQMVQEQATVRQQGQQEVESLRATWQATNEDVHGELTTIAQEQHAGAQTQIQDTVTTGEDQVDALLTQAEEQAAAERTAAESQADQIRAKANERASAALSEGEGAGTNSAANQILADAETEVARLLAEVLELIQQLIDAARRGAFEEVERLRQEVETLIADASEVLATLLDEAMPEYELIAEHYLEQIDMVMDTISNDLDALQTAYHVQSQSMLDGYAMALEGKSAKLLRLAEEVEIIAGAESLDALGERFGITFTQPEGEDGWTEQRQEVVMLGAIATEHAFRRSDRRGVLDDHGFGEAFDTVFGGMEMYYDPNQATRTVIDSDTGEERQVPYGADGSRHKITWYDAAFDVSDESFLRNVVHELGHSFNANTGVNGVGEGYTDFDNEAIMAPVDYEVTELGDGTYQYTIDAFGTTLQVSSRRSEGPIVFEQNGQRWVIEIENGEARLAIAGQAADSAGNAVNIPRNYNRSYGIGPYPYMQNNSDATGEEFADMFENWVLDSFEDNAAGGARYDWMDEHMFGDPTDHRYGNGTDDTRGWVDIAISNNSGNSGEEQQAAATETGATPQSDTQTPDTYVVQANDTLSGIAARYGVTVEALAEANGITDPRLIRVGQELTIPDGQ